MIRCTHCSSQTNRRFGLQFSSFSEIYSLNNNSWRKIDCGMHHSDKCGEEVYMDGMSHWWDIEVTHTYLVSFDFSNESFITTPIPSFEGDTFDFDFNYNKKRQLVVLNGSIAFIANYKETTGGIKWIRCFYSKL
ncbi:putative F-box associated interaction domain-containing protein [Medicago truncatula]|uniref:Putative F-box associated interaction domain-containing protein n=1 Tax=Medicago truncatula TaxID=3880 RepID=A0A396HXS6_MEDTR|nr:putative F-box associated interaction domain-containing protein [Medicago truncatula]